MWVFFLFCDSCLQRNFRFPRFLICSSTVWKLVTRFRLWTVGSEDSVLTKVNSWPVDDVALHLVSLTSITYLQHQCYTTLNVQCHGLYGRFEVSHTPRTISYNTSPIHYSPGSQSWAQIHNMTFSAPYEILWSTKVLVLSSTSGLM